MTEPSSAGSCSAAGCEAESAVDPSLEEVSGSEVGMVEIGFIGTCGRMEPRNPWPNCEGLPYCNRWGKPPARSWRWILKLFVLNDLWRLQRDRREPRHRLSSAWNGGLRLGGGLRRVPQERRPVCGSRGCFPGEAPFAGLRRDAERGGWCLGRFARGN